jgi:hypothetical protein
MTYFEDRYAEEDAYQRTMAPPPPPPPRRLMERPGTAVPEQNYAEQAYSMRPPEPVGDPRLSVYREPYARADQPVYRESAPPPREYNLTRAYSVHPPANPEYYRHGTVAPRSMNPNPPMPGIPRARSVYPMRYASGPVPQHEARFAEAEPTDLYGDQRRVSNRF